MCLHSSKRFWGGFPVAFRHISVFFKWSVSWGFIPFSLICFTHNIQFSFLFLWSCFFFLGGVHRLRFMVHRRFERQSISLPCGLSLCLICLIKQFSLLSSRTSQAGWLIVLFYDVSTLFGSFNTEWSHFDKSFKQFILV